jgi:2-keto-4-pentenoate hydratase/2-oxohepta-3-ene-1,7-dioic acid hydratase in catechol pathway
MKLIRWGAPGAEAPGAVDAHGTARDLSALVRDWSGRALDPAALHAAASLDLSRFPPVPDGARLGPPVGGVGKILCVGLNYADHAAETGATPPAEPILFLKPSSAVAGPDDDVRIPSGSRKTDWEVELGVVIGRSARGVSEDDALDHVAGYCVCNDLSEREWQLEGTGTWDKGKGADGFGPLGPWLVTVDEVADPQSLRLWLEVNGERVQDGSTATMIFGVRTLVSYASRYFSLHPGDVISTGTPPGVGLGLKPPRFLKAGDEVRLGIDGLGEQRQRFIA